MRIGEVAERAGVSVRALRYYEEQGLVVADRTRSGHRDYAESAVVQVRFIQLLYSAGLASRAIAEILPIIEGGLVTPEMLAQMTSQRAHLREKIDELTLAHRRLGELIEVATQFTDSPGVPTHCLQDA